MTNAIQINESTIAKMQTIVRNWDGMTEKIEDRLFKTYAFTADSFLLEDMAAHTAKRTIVAQLRMIVTDPEKSEETVIAELTDYRAELTDQLLNIRLHSSTSQASNLIDNKENEFLASVVRQLTRIF